MSDVTADGGLGPLGDEGAAEGLTFSTTLEPGRFLGLSLKNGLLNLVTLTLYRFWGKTEVRQRVWRGLRLNGESFEYTGRGVELFIGFLLALLVLGAPFLGVVFAVQFLGEWFILVAYLPLYLFMFWLWGFGTFAAFRYMASRTTWRGVRFQLKGSAASYGLHYLGAVLLSGLTAGWYWPSAERNLAGKIWGGLRFGDRPLRFRKERAEAEGVYGAYAIGWIGTLVGYFVFIGVFMAAALSTGGLIAESPDGPVAVPDLAFVFAFYGIALLIAPFALLLWAPYQAAMLRSVVAGVRLDDATFRLKVKAIPLWWLTVTNLFLLLITLGFLMPWAQARTARFLAERLESTGEARLDLARQAGRGPGSGEGLADAFGFSAI
ncbi:YjgN family protein [Brevundimonas sp. LjRoot202]|uniref:YjgN family protein n=1 Tax=Brevundimonas sp. LjRoot202 TaxID=3342281 RepID=UPI003ED0C384